jgi:DNA polymerase elongation subunit (family B)
MSQNFYTYAWQYGNSILVRGVRNGKRFTERHPFTPTLYVKSAEQSQYKSIDGQNLKEITFGDNSDCKEFLDNYSKVENYPIYGQTDLTYQYLSSVYPDELTFDMSQMKILSIDIETTAEHGFPDVENPIEEVLLISVIDNATKEIHTWGAGEWKCVSEEVEGLPVTYHYCSDEYDLLEQFMQWWASDYPDIVTGWNMEQFDMPYLVNRIDRVFGNDAKNNLSPYGMTRKRMVRGHNREIMKIDMKGVIQLDYMDLYKKFTYTFQESYRLDYIAEVELGKNKLEMGFETFREFYEGDWNRFIDYNIIDTKLVDELDDKMKFLELIITMAYDCKCNYNDIFSSVRTWDCLLYNHLLDKGIMIPQKKEQFSDGFPGGYVQEPKTGKYKWIVSVDATSLYPSIIMQHNLSPEMLATNHKPIDCTVDSILDRKHKLKLDDSDLSMAANGYLYHKDRQGFMAEITQKFFDDRQRYKKLMKQAEQEYEDTKNPALKNDIAKYHNFQMARKIQLNSLFGAIGNKWFRYFDERIAESITLTGQLIIRDTAKVIDEFMNKFLDTEGEVYSFYTDTDSCYLTLDKMVEKHLSGKSREEIINVLDKFVEDKLVPSINGRMSELGDYMNVFDKKIDFKREAIADTGIWVAKKRYAMNVWDNEGVRYKEAKLKVMGLEIVRSSTPAPVRSWLKEAVALCLVADEKELQTYVEETWQRFRSMDPELIAFPRGCNNLGKYMSRETVYTKGTPMHVRGALVYNHLCKTQKIENKYQLIQDGDKIKYVYLKEPNHIRENCVAMNGLMPKEFDLHRYIDYDTQFQKAFLDPLNTIVESLNWNTKPVATLEGLFS